MNSTGIITIISFIGMFFIGGIIIALYLYMERSKNIAKSIDHVWIQLIPKAGAERNFRIPVEHNGGVTYCKVPDIHGKTGDDSPIHILGEPGEFPGIYPPGKMKFVQVQMTKLIFYEGDAEPLSNVSNIPIISGQLFASLLNGLCASTAEIVRRSRDQEGNQQQGNKLTLLYILAGAGTLASVIAAIIGMKVLANTGQIPQIFTLLRQALGLK